MVLFVLLPFAAAGLVVPLVAWRYSGDPKPVLTSQILATGEEASARIVAVRNMGTIVDTRPMVRFQLEITAGAGAPFELEVFQAIPRSLVGRFRPGDRVEVRVTPDHQAGAVVWEY